MCSKPICESRQNNATMSPIRSFGQTCHSLICEKCRENQGIVSKRERFSMLDWFVANGQLDKHHTFIYDLVTTNRERLNRKKKLNEMSIMNKGTEPWATSLYLVTGRYWCELFEHAQQRDCILSLAWKSGGHWHEGSYHMYGVISLWPSHPMHLWK